MVVCPSFSRPPNNGTLLLLWAQTSSEVSSAMAFCSLAHGAMLPRPSGCLHTANPSPLLGIELRSVNLSAQPLLKHLSLWCLVAVVQIVCVAHILLCPRSSCCAFLGNFEVPPSWQISPSIRWLPGCGFLSSFTAPSQECQFHPDSFSLLPPTSFSFVLPSYVKGFLPFLKV